MNYRISHANILLILLSLAMSSSLAHSAPPKIVSYPVATATVISEAPRVDGRLSEPVWKNATQLGPFGDMLGKPVKNETRALLLRSDDTLFIGVMCHVSKSAKLKTDQTKRDSDVWTDESIEVFIDPTLSFRNYFHFIVNAANIQRDEKGDKTVAPPFDEDWNGTWQSGTSHDGSAWYAELAIPFGTIGLTPGEPALIGLNVCRNDHTTNETTCWSPTISGFHEPVRFGVVSLPNKQAAAHVNLKVTRYNETQVGKCVATLSIKSEGKKAAGLHISVTAGNESDCTRSKLTLPEVSPIATNIKATYTIKEAGDNAVVVAVKDSNGNAVGIVKSVFSLPEGLLQEYGYRITGGEQLGLWWAESTYKIHRDKALPSRASNAVRLSAAGREFEAVQIVVRPKRDTNISLAVSDFKGTSGHISAEHFKIFEVAYVPVNIPSDSFGWPDKWPDPLPPLEGPLHCAADVNQPFWLLAYIPPGTKQGIYRGKVNITADEISISVPVVLRVYGFELTVETHTRTAYGVSPNYGFLGAKTTEQKRKIYDLYMQSCRDHRISPYSPMRFYPMDIKLHAPMRKFGYGKFAVEIEIGQQHPWKLYWKGEEVATQRTSMTHFEKKGVGWKGTGVGWPYVDTIEAITDVSDNPRMRVLDVVAAHTGSGAAARSYKLTFRLFIPAGDNWFGMKLIKMEGTDPTEIEVREYYNIPNTTFKAKEIANGKDFAAWSGDGVGFGMICIGSAVRGLNVKSGTQGVTVSNPVSPFKIKNGKTHDGWGPLVVYFVTDKTSSKDLTSRAAELRERINPNNLSAYIPKQQTKVVEERKDDYTFIYDFTKFDEGASRYLDQFHFNGFNMPCMPGHIGRYRRFTDGYKRLHKIMYGPVIEHLRKKGWLKYAYSYWFDEPSEKDYQYVIEGMKLLGEDCPGLTRLLTEQPEKELYGVVDLWVPVLSMYRKNRCQERQTNGDKVWWYVCCGPRAPYPNNFVDHPAIHHRIRFWMAELYGVTGSLYWSTTYYGSKPKPEGGFRNPWEDGMTYRPSGGYWGNGDGMLLYPACRKRSKTPVIKGPVVSIRFETIRDGIEDREYFWTLKQEVTRLQAIRKKADKKERQLIDALLQQSAEALASPGRLAKSLIKFTEDPQKLLQERDKLANAIEACRKYSLGR